MGWSYKGVYYLDKTIIDIRYRFNTTKDLLKAKETSEYSIEDMKEEDKEVYQSFINHLYESYAKA